MLILRTFVPKKHHFRHMPKHTDTKLMDSIPSNDCDKEGLNYETSVIRFCN